MATIGEQLRGLRLLGRDQKRWTPSRMQQAREWRKSRAWSKAVGLALRERVDQIIAKSGVFDVN
jgi:hypothetical protein